MKRPRTALPLLLLVVSLVPFPAVAGVLSEPEVSAFVRPVMFRQQRLAQIGGIGSEKPKDEKETEEIAEKNQGPSPQKAMFYSLLLPGLGQQYSGREERARVFYAVEAAIWASFVAFRLQGDSREDRSIEFAEYNAGVVASGKNDDYWRLISNFERSDPGAGSANEMVRRQARALYPDDREKQEEYFLENGYFGDDAWDWKSPDNLDQYRELRSKSIDSYDKAEFSLGLAIVNRLVSMIDAARVARSARKEAESESGEKHDSLEMQGRFGMKLAKDGDDRVPMLTYKLKF